MCMRLCMFVCMNVCVRTCVCVNIRIPANNTKTAFHWYHQLLLKVSTIVTKLWFVLGLNLEVIFCTFLSKLYICISLYSIRNDEINGWVQLIITFSYKFHVRTYNDSHRKQRRTLFSKVQVCWSEILIVVKMISIKLDIQPKPISNIGFWIKISAAFYGPTNGMRNIERMSFAYVVLFK